MRSDRISKDTAVLPSFTEPTTSKDNATGAVADKNAAAGSMQAILSGDFADPATLRGKYTLEQLLKSKGDERLPDVDPTKKEQYLNDEEFVKAFPDAGSRSEFEKLAKWKRDKMKKAAGLF